MKNILWNSLYEVLSGNCAIQKKKKTILLEKWMRTKVYLLNSSKEKSLNKTKNASSKAKKNIY